VGCLVVLLGAIFPRVAVLAIWLARPLYFDQAIGPLFAIAGIIFAPFTTLMYVLLWSPSTGISGLDWVWLALAFVIDLAGYGTSAWGGRYQVPNRESY
jgi:hypothetical protein